MAYEKNFDFHLNVTGISTIKEIQNVIDNFKKNPNIKFNTTIDKRSTEVASKQIAHNIASEVAKGIKIALDEVASNKTNFSKFNMSVKNSVLPGMLTKQDRKISEFNYYKSNFERLTKSGFFSHDKDSAEYRDSMKYTRDFSKWIMKSYESLSTDAQSKALDKLKEISEKYSSSDDIVEFLKKHGVYDKDIDMLKEKEPPKKEDKSLEKFRYSMSSGRSIADTVFSILSHFGKVMRTLTSYGEDFSRSLKSNKEAFNDFFGHEGKEKMSWIERSAQKTKDSIYAKEEDYVKNRPEQLKKELSSLRSQKDDLVKKNNPKDAKKIADITGKIADLDKEQAALEKGDDSVTRENAKKMTNDSLGKAATKYAVMSSVASTLSKIITDIAKSLADFIVTEFKAAWEKMTKMATYDTANSLYYNRNAVTQQLETGLDNAGNYGLSQALSKYGFNGYSDFLNNVAYMNQNQIDNFKEEMKSYMDEYEKLQKTGYFDKIQQFQESFADFKRDFQLKIMDFFINNESVIENAMNVIINALPKILNFIAGLVDFFAGGSYDGVDSAVSSDTVASYSTVDNSNKSSNSYTQNFYIDGTYDAKKSSTTDSAYTFVMNQQMKGA